MAIKVISWLFISFIIAVLVIIGCDTTTEIGLHMIIKKRKKIASKDKNILKN